MGSPAALVSTGVSASNNPPPLVDTATTVGVSDVGVGATRKASVGSGVQVGGGATEPAVETSDGGTQADCDGVAATNDADVGVSPIVAIEQPSDSSNAESNNENPAVEQPEPSKAPFVETAETPSTAAAEEKSKGSTAEEESKGTLQAQEVAEGSDNRTDQDGSAFTTAIMEDTDGMVPAKRPETVENPGGDGVLEPEREEQVVGSSIVETRETKDTSATIKREGGNEKGGKEKGDEVMERGERMQNRVHDDDDTEHRSTDSRGSRGRDTSTACPTDAGANGRGRDRYESIDGEALLGKLLDEDAPSAAFEDDHQKLLHKLMRVRDDEYVSDVPDSLKNVHVFRMHSMAAVLVEAKYYLGNLVVLWIQTLFEGS